MKRNAMRTQATQTDRGRNSAHISSPSGLPMPPQKPQFQPQKVSHSTLRLLKMIRVSTEGDLQKKVFLQFLH